MKKKILLLITMLTLGLANLIGQYTINYLGPITNHPSFPVTVYVKVNGVLIDSTLTNVATANYNDSANSVTLPTTMEVYIIDCNGVKQSQTATFSRPPGTGVYIFGYNAMTYCPNTCAAQFTKHQAVDPVTRLPIPNQLVIVNTSTGGTAIGSGFTWNWGDGNTSTGMTPTHTYSTHGSYIICLTMSTPSCTSTFCDTITVDSLGILRSSFTVTVGTATASLEENNSISEINMYPNPATTNLNLNFNSVNSTELNIQIIDISGKTIRNINKQINSGKNQLNITLNDLERGVYFIKLNNGNNIITKKLYLVN